MPIPIPNFSSSGSGKAMLKEACAFQAKFKIRHGCQDNQNLSTGTLLLKPVSNWARAYLAAVYFWVQLSFNTGLKACFIKYPPTYLIKTHLKYSSTPVLAELDSFREAIWKYRFVFIPMLFLKCILYECFVCMSVSHVHVWSTQNSGQSMGFSGTANGCELPHRW